MSLGLTPAGQLRWASRDGEPVPRGIDGVIAEKRQLAHDLMDGGGENDLTRLSDDEPIDLVRRDVTRANPQAES